MLRRLVKPLLALVCALAAAEFALHLTPALLPPAYRARFPGNGTELFHPGVRARTPVEGVLLPHLASAHRGPPPADLVELGLAPPAAAEDDARAVPSIELPAGALGFPNPPEVAARERADLVLVGDSFGVSAGVRAPPGLQAELERATGLAVLNLSLAGLGPVQERGLLETHGLARPPRAPRAVVWLWFSGNDLTASYEPLLARRDGKTTWAEAWPERAVPLFRLPGVLAALVAGAPAPPRREPLPGFAFPTADGGTRPVWFHPDYLRQLGWSRAEWEAFPTWQPVQAELAAARDACAAHGARIVLVYLPTKAEVLLPLVARDAELVVATLGALGQPPPTGLAEEVLETLLAHRGAQEDLVRDACESAGIPFLSATPALTALAGRGELGYLVADTHWTSEGQAALLAPLLAFLRAEGVLE
jgi:hypothetical protein